MSVVPVQPGLSYAATGARPEPTVVVGNGGGDGVASAAAASATGTQTPPLDPLMAALSQALSAAAARQNGLAPLFANLAALIGRSDLPEAVRNAAQTLLNLRLSGTAIEGGTLRQAIGRSGLFVEAVQASGLTPVTNIKSALQHMRAVLQGLLDAGTAPVAANPAALPATAQGATAPGATAALPAPAAAAVAEPGVRQAAMAMLSETEAMLAPPMASAAGPRADGMTPLSDNLDMLLAQPHLPAAVRNAAQALLGLRFAAVPQLPSASSALPLGVLLPDAAMADAAVRMATQNLRDALKGFLGVDSAPPEGRTAPLPPPFRGALPVAQPPMQATIAGASLRDAATTVLAQTDAAIARHVMLQIASLPASQQPSHPPDDHSVRLVFDIPLATPQGTMIVQVQVERDAPQREAQAPVLSVRFAVDIEPIGPVRARVAHIGGKTSVTMVAEKPASATALQQDIGSLRAALAQAALEPGDLHCLSHDQTRVTAPQGQFVNRAS